MRNIYLQYYSFGEFHPDKNEECFKAAADMGYAGLELFGPNFAAGPEKISEWLKTYGLDAISMHADTDHVVSMIPFAKAVGARFIGIGMQYMPDEASVYAFAERLNEIGAACRDEGLTLVYHNHTQEFKKYGDKTVLELLLENTKPDCLSLEMDAGWVAAAGASPIEFVERYGDRVKLIHVKESDAVIGVLGQWNPADMVFDADGVPVFGEEQKAEMERSEGVNCPAGKGLVNWKELADLADQKGCRGYIVERERTYEGALSRMECLAADIAYYKTVL